MNEDLQKIKQSPIGGFILGVALSAIAFLGSVGLIDEEAGDAARHLKSTWHEQMVKDYADIRAEFHAAVADGTMSSQNLNTFAAQQQYLNSSNAQLLALYDVLGDYLTEEQYCAISDKVFERVPKLLEELKQANEPKR